MLKNYIKTTIRNLLKHKGYSAINIVGLAIGMACCILILLFVQNELSYDRHHENAERIYRVAGDMVFGGNHLRLAVAPAPMAKALVDDFPEVITAVRFRGQGSFLIRKQGEQENFKEQRIIFADNAIFDIFTIPFIEGESQAPLAEPNNIVISRSSAKKYFPNESAVGQTLILDDEEPFKVTGVFEDMPEASHFHFDFIASLLSLDESRNNLWVSNNFRTYILLQEGADPKALEAKFPHWIRKYLEPQVQELMGATYDEMLQAGNSVRYYLQPLLDIHLHSDLTAEFEPNGNINYVYIFSAIAFFILLIACINFMNLSTARSASRAREVGIRKVVGSIRRQLVGQFLTESVFLSLIAMLLAIGLVELALPFFNQLAEKNLQVSYLSNLSLVGILLAVTVLVGIGAGSYPALVLSGFRPVNVLKGKLQMGTKSGWLRSALVIFQFAASVVLIIGTIIVQDQMRYIQNKELGFKKEQVLIVHDAYALGADLPAFRNEVQRNPQVVSGTVSSYLPVSSSRSDTGFWPEGQRSEDKNVSMQIWSVDYDYIETMGMEIVAGRDFSQTFGADSSAIILNERAARMFGFDDPIGKRIYTFDFNPATGIDPDNHIRYTIVGVVQDFHFESLKENIGALGMRLGSSRGLISFRFKVEDVAEVLTAVRSKWQELAPGQPFAYSFLDDRFARMYQAEQRVGDIFGVFAGLAIFTACLGLFGLASFAAEQRTKEIGVRKVMGATVSNIVFMFSKEFARFVLVAGVIATPIAWYFMREWLANFAYRTSLSPGTFLLATLVALLIALATVSYQAIRAALTNPSDALRYE